MSEKMSEFLGELRSGVKMTDISTVSYIKQISADGEVVLELRYVDYHDKARMLPVWQIWDFRLRDKDSQLQIIVDNRGLFTRALPAKYRIRYAKALVALKVQWKLLVDKQ